ncbi:hypothetical protein [Massilia sp. TWR1-2-2]
MAQIDTGDDTAAGVVREPGRGRLFAHPDAEVPQIGDSYYY